MGATDPIYTYIFSIRSTYTFSVQWHVHILYSCIHILNNSLIELQTYSLFHLDTYSLCECYSKLLYSNCIYILYSFFKFMHSVLELNLHTFSIWTSSLSFSFLYMFSGLFSNWLHLLYLNCKHILYSTSMHNFQLNYIVFRYSIAFSTYCIYSSLYFVLSYRGPLFPVFLWFSVCWMQGSS